jgi:glycosyltransferase involved in cell wall biosynthesis
MRTKLSILIPAFNEEINIRECLESVQWADEVMVVDSFSTDRTLEIARPLCHRIIQREYGNSASQKNWAIPQAAHEWVMIVDSDERVTPQLQAEIEGLLKGGPDGNGYYIRRLNHFWGKPVRHCGWERDKVLRLFKRDMGRYLDREVHADVIIEGPVRTLDSYLLHYTYRSFEQYFKKFHRYTNWGADECIKRGKELRWHHLLLHPPFRFFKMYLLQKGFLDGLAGIILCGLASFSVFMKYARLWEKTKTNQASTKEVNNQ